MNRLQDNQYALRIIKMLAQDFKQFDAYKLGIIDKDGNVLKKSYQLKSEKEKKAYTYLTRLVVILKKEINKAKRRGDITTAKALSPALFLVKEQIETGSRAVANMDKKYNELLSLDVTLAEETILIEKFLDEEGAAAGVGGGAPTNNVGGGQIAGVSRETGGPVIKKKNIDQFRKIARRSMPKLKTLVPTEGK